MTFRRAVFAVICFVSFQGAWAAPFTYFGENYRTDFETKETFLSGNVRIEYLDRLFFADKAVLDGKTQVLKAEGNIKVTRGEMVITAKKATINMSTGYGSFYDAILRSGNSLYLEGREIEAYDKDRYRVYQGKLSRCQDCPQSWSVTGAYMDLEVEGFLEAHHALIQIRDVPVIYLPTYFLPLKTKRQSGFLLPRYYRFAELGNGIAVPYYRVLSDSADTTLEYLYTDRVKNGGGHRFGNEVIYSFSDRTFVDTNMTYLLRANDNDYDGTLTGNNRFGGTVSERWQLSPQLVQRFRTEFSSDPRYSYQFEGDFPSSRLPTLDTELSLAWQNDNLFAYGQGRLHQDNLPRKRTVWLSPTTPALTDPPSPPIPQGNIQELPELGFSWASFGLVGPLRGNVDLKYVNFSRAGNSLDTINFGTVGTPDNVTWIREGRRATAIARVVAPVDVSVFQWKSSLELRSDVYSFSAPGVPVSAVRGRYLVDQTFGTNFSRVWMTDLAELKALKHTIEPYVRWTYSDHDWTSSHPFFEQGKTVGTRLRAPQFDIFDPYGDEENGIFGTANEEQRLRANNIFTFGLGSRLIGRYGESSRSYETLLGVLAMQDIDFYQRDPVTGQPSLGLFRLEGYGGYGGVGFQSALAVNWQAQKADFGNVVSYRWSRYMIGMHQRGEGSNTRYYGVSGSVSNWGPWSLSGEYTFNDRTRLRDENGNRLPNQDVQKYRIEYSGSDSLCWFFNVAFVKEAVNKNFSWTPQIGFVLDETGKRASVDSMLNKKRTAR